MFECGASHAAFAAFASIVDATISPGGSALDVIVDLLAAYCFLRAFCFILIPDCLLQDDIPIVIAMTQLVRSRYRYRCHRCKTAKSKAGRSKGGSEQTGRDIIVSGEPWL